MPKFKNYDGVSENLYTYNDFPWLNENPQVQLLWGKMRHHVKKVLNSIYYAAKEQIVW